MSLDRINALLGRYRLVWYALLALMLAAGFGWDTPAAQFRRGALRDSILTFRHDSLLAGVRMADLITQGQARYTCLKDEANARMAGLPCSLLGVARR